MFDANMCYIKKGKKFVAEVRGTLPEHHPLAGRGTRVFLCTMLSRNNRNPTVLFKDTEGEIALDNNTSGMGAWIVYAGNTDGTGFIHEDVKKEANDLIKAIKSIEEPKSFKTVPIRVLQVFPYWYEGATHILEHTYKNNETFYSMVNKVEEGKFLEIISGVALSRSWKVACTKADHIFTRKEIFKDLPSDVVCVLPSDEGNELHPIAELPLGALVYADNRKRFLPLVLRGKLIPRPSPEELEYLESVIADSRGYRL